MPGRHPLVLFICTRNAGKSQMAEAITRLYAGDRVEVHSAGTMPKGSINRTSAATVAEIGASMEGAVSTGVDPDTLRRADHVIVLGTEATVESVPGMRSEPEVWVTDEPSHRGIEGTERMRLIRDNIAERVRRLLRDFGVPPSDTGASGS
ncbi:low molecular weight phosphatase family protein [Corynebacterium sp. P6129]|uniref:arsenate-mycothiol transferase ArsC n=1 Tax=Corynebacterium antarcticum TaxID=2800405 RepID=UPI00226102F9|nr:low molecular weight phosphatase family protein [Corynebacterium antarcticum]MCX7491119.1 low molecular weight phosphatase family protein [Corynebacterium antarcticum]